MNIKDKARTARNSETEAKFEPRIRFNWGYHQGADDARRGKAMLLRHFDKAYHAGHDAGFQDARQGGYDDNANSDHAWNDYRKVMK